MQTAVELNLAYQNLDQYFTGWYEKSVGKRCLKIPGCIEYCIIV